MRAWWERQKYKLFVKLVTPTRMVKWYIAAIYKEYAGKPATERSLHEIEQEMAQFLCRVYYPVKRVSVKAKFIEGAIDIAVNLEKMDYDPLTLVKVIVK